MKDFVGSSSLAAAREVVRARRLCFSSCWHERRDVPHARPTRSRAHTLCTSCIGSERAGPAPTPHTHRGDAMFERLKTRYRDRKLDRELRRVLAHLTPDERAELSSVLDQIATLPPDAISRAAPS